MRWFLILAFAALPARAQVVEIAGGSSTLLESSGAAATFHFADQSIMMSAGEVNGKMALGFADTRDFHGWAVTLGDKPFAAQAGGAGLGVGVRGVSLTRHIEDRGCTRTIPAGRRVPGPVGYGAPCWIHASTLTIFAGATGPSFSAPYLMAATAQHFGAGIFYEYQISHGVVANFLGVTAGSRRTGIGALNYKWRGLSVQGAAGVIENARYWNMALSIHPVRWANFTAARTTEQLATVNSASGAVQAGRINFHGAAFQSGQSSGEAFGTGTRISFLEFRADEFLSRRSKGFTGMVGQRIGRHFQVNEFLARSGGTSSFNFGGTYVSNRFALSISQQTYFVPLNPARPFQQALAVTISFRAPHDSAITVATNLDPTGKLRWGVYGNTFAYGSWQSSGQPRRARRGGYLIAGNVKDKSGMPVSGAAVAVADQIAYTDATGTFTARVKRVPAPINVSLDDFAAPGTWLVVSAPASAQPGTPVAIVLSQQ